MDVERFTPEADSHARIVGDPAFLTVRRLSERMGHTLLLRAFATVASDRPDARLYIAAERAAAGDVCRRYVRDRYTWERTVTALESHYSGLVR